jgi:hypothetical protein
MRRPLLACALAVTWLVAAAPVAKADHVPTNIGTKTGIPIDKPLTQKGDWRFLANLPNGPVHVPWSGADWETFTRDGRRYVVASSTGWGITVIDATDPTKPVWISNYSSASSCPHNTARYIPDGVMKKHIVIETVIGAQGGWENDLDITPDGRFVVLGTDGPGRCHDPLWGGAELVDLTDVTNPRLVHLVRTRGDAHSISIDRGHPWLIWTSTSDQETLSEIIDFRSCLGGAAEKDRCRPVVARADFPDAWTAPDPTVAAADTAEGCHDIKFRGMRAYCGAITASIILDTSGVVDAAGNLTGTHLTDPSYSNHCTIEDADPVTAPGFKVTDCSNVTEEIFRDSGAKSVGVRLVSAIHHGGPDTTKPPNEDVQISHQAEWADDGRIMFVADERGGGLQPYACPAGGVWFYNTTDEAHPRLMHQPDGSPGVFFAQTYTATTPNLCTVHYGSQLAGENIMVFAWYSIGTHVFRFFPDYAKNEIRFEEIGVYTPAAANTWTSKALMRNPENPDEILVYTADINRGIDAFALRAPRATTVKVKPVVKSRQISRPLANTGVGMPADVGVALLGIASVLAARPRRTPPR